MKEAARAVSERDEKLLAEKLDKLAQANEEVDGDDSEESDDEGMGDIDVEKTSGLSMDESGSAAAPAAKKPAKKKAADSDEDD